MSYFSLHGVQQRALQKIQVTARGELKRKNLALHDVTRHDVPILDVKRRV